MYTKLLNLSEIKNYDELIDNSYNGTCFAYKWFLKLKKCDTVLAIYSSKDDIISVMPLFKNNSDKIIFQSTMYIPYGGFIILKLPTEERNKIKFIRELEKKYIDYFTSNYTKVNFSTDPKIEDIMPFIRSGFTPELRYTYKIDLTIGIDNIYKNFGSDRKKDIKKALKQGYKFIVDNDNGLFDVQKSMKWEKNYGNDSTVEFVKKYINKSIKENKGMNFITMDNDGKVAGGVHLTWDTNTAYILYSYYEKKQDDVAIAFIYYNMIKYLINDTKIKELDFEGSVFESIENWNISFGAYQSRFYNLHWNKEKSTYSNLYDYGEKNG